MGIIKRKKGRGEFYYIQHSFRKGRKIITKERYLGKEIPKDLEKIEKSLLENFEVDLNNKLNSIREHFQKEWKKTPESARERELKEIAIAFTYNTNAIEGSTITLEETREILEDRTAPNKPLREIKETEAHSKVFLEMLNKKEKISEKMILRWHAAIFGDTKQDIAGRYREYLVRVGNYLAPDWQDVKILMGKLLDFIAKDKGKLNPVELAGGAHYRFEKVHPFGDGNGRIGRLLLNKILWDNGYPMLIIENKKRKSYYKALKKDEESFVKYFIRRYFAVHKKRLERERNKEYNKNI